jgi:hypothetical protein
VSQLYLCFFLIKLHGYSFLTPSNTFSTQQCTVYFSTVHTESAVLNITPLLRFLYNCGDRTDITLPNNIVKIFCKA